MVNVFLELERLKSNLLGRGLDNDAVSEIVRKAETDISFALREKMDNALDLAVQSGVQKESSEFINELRPRYDAFTLDTESGNTDFSEPPMPMLDKLLMGGAKPIKDGSGVYKVIPVGAPSKQPKNPVHANIFDAQKSISAERYENAVAQYNKVAPKNSKVNFRTATSKQNRNSMWVQPAKDKDFTEDLSEINRMLGNDHDDVIMSIIRSYEEGF